MIRIRPHIRLLPMLILFCLTALVARVAEMGLKYHYVALPIAFQGMQLEAVGDAQAEGKDAEGKDSATAEADKEKEQDKEEKGKEEEKEKETEGNKKEEKKDQKKVSKDKKTKEPAAPKFSAYEVELLKNLSVRRKELDVWEKKLTEREHLAEATEAKLDTRLNELKTLKTDVEQLLKAYNEKEDLKIRSLVKIYENMKPKDAARIFEQMDMEILLQVVDKMKEAMVAPILASMNPEKAKEVTERLAKERKLPVPENN